MRSRWSAEAEAKEPDAPCRRINSVYTIHAILAGVPVLPDGYGSLSEMGFPQARAPLCKCTMDAGTLTHFELGSFEALHCCGVPPLDLAS